jgi:hypothetical protein
MRGLYRLASIAHAACYWSRHALLGQVLTGKEVITMHTHLAEHRLTAPDVLSMTAQRDPSFVAQPWTTHTSLV